jgi:hypothetical protein
MQSKALTADEYICQLPEDRKQVVSRIREIILRNLPEGFSEEMNYGMIGYVVPHSLYPAGYHSDPGQPLPFISVASQKNYISIYHMALYDDVLLDWLIAKWQAVSEQKLDLGKCCIRLKKFDTIPFDLIGELASKLTPLQWIEKYEHLFKH